MSTPPPPSWPVRVAAIGPVAMGSTLWRQSGQLWVTAIVKSSFAFSMDHAMSLVASEPVRRSDECARGVPSLRGAAEIAPQMVEVDVTLHGHAYAPPGSVRSTVRLAVEREGKPLIDKALVIVGKRKREEDAPRPFERMRIGYERALGGLEFPDNPIGIGADVDSDAQPNVLHPRDPKRRVAGLGPIPSRFPARRKLRGKLDAALIEQGIASYPADFMWSYFQTAPADQRLPRIFGDEWLLLEGLHPTHPRIRTQLPRPRAVLRVYQHKDVGAPPELALAADTLHIDADEARCTILWRAAFPIVSELAAEQLVLAGGVELPGKQLHWPADLSEIDRLASPEVDTAALAGGVDYDLQRTAPAGSSPHNVIPPPPSVPSSPGAMRPVPRASSPTAGAQSQPTTSTSAAGGRPTAPGAHPLERTMVVAQTPYDVRPPAHGARTHLAGLDQTLPVTSTESTPPAPKAPSAAGQGRTGAGTLDATTHLDVDDDPDVEVIDEVDAADEVRDHDTGGKKR